MGNARVPASQSLLTCLSSFHSVTRHAPRTCLAGTHSGPAFSFGILKANSGPSQASSQNCLTNGPACGISPTHLAPSRGDRELQKTEIISLLTRTEGGGVG